MLHLFVFRSVVCGLSSPSFERILLTVTYEKEIECKSHVTRDVRPLRLELKDSKYNKLCNGFHHVVRMLSPSILVISVLISVIKPMWFLKCVTGGIK